MSNHAALIWISIGNSYFDEETIQKVLSTIAQKFDKVLVIAPDRPAEHTFAALGYSQSKAKRKAKLNANLFQNRAKRVIESFDDELKEKFIVVEWSKDISNNEEFLEKYKLIQNLYKTNQEFREDANKITQEVIEEKIKEGISLEKAVNEAVYYLLKELAFILASQQIYKVEEITYVYHNDWKFLKDFIKGKYDKKSKNKIHFLLHRVKE